METLDLIFNVIIKVGLIVAFSLLIYVSVFTVVRTRQIRKVEKRNDEEFHELMKNLLEVAKKEKEQDKTKKNTNSNNNKPKRKYVRKNTKKEENK